jgi:THO complex subunit 3
MPSDGRHVSSAWSPDGNYAVAVNEDNYIALYDMRTQTRLKRIRSANEANELAWTADSNYLLVSAMLNGGPSGGIEILEWKDGNLNLQDSLTAHTANCLYLKIDPTFRRVALGGEDHLLSMWDLDDLICTHTVHCESSVKSLTFSGDGRRIAASTEAGTILVCDSLSSDIVGKHVLPRLDRATHIAWHPTVPVIALGVDSKAPIASYLRLLTVPSSMQ